MKNLEIFAQLKESKNGLIKNHEEGIALIFAIMAIGALVGAGFVTYLDGLSRDNTEQYNSLFFQGTIAAINNNIHTILTNNSSLAASILNGVANGGSYTSSCPVDFNSCNAGTTSSNVSLAAGNLPYYNTSSKNDGFLTTGFPCILGNLPGESFFSLNPMTNSAGICLVQPTINWTPSCFGGGGSCGITLAPNPLPATNYVQSNISIAYTVPTNFGKPTNASPPGLGYSPYTGLNDYPMAVDPIHHPLPNGFTFTGVPAVTELGWQYANY